MTIDILWMGGTGYGAGGDGVSEDFRRWLMLMDTVPERFRFSYVDYPGDFGVHGRSYDESVAQGMSQLTAAIADSANPVIIGGYSQGAEVAGEVARAYIRGMSQHTIRGVILIADPWRPEGVGGMDGSGIRGERGLDDMPTLWCSNPGDPITALPEGNPLRSVADIATLMAASVDPVRAAQLWSDVTAAVRTGRLQRWWDIRNWQTWNGALRYAKGYLFDGRHTLDYVRNGLCATLARQVVDRAWTE